jgi:hypothetical protein
VSLFKLQISFQFIVANSKEAQTDSAIVVSRDPVLDVADLEVLCCTFTDCTRPDSDQKGAARLRSD